MAPMIAPVERKEEGTLQTWGLPERDILAVGDS